MCVISLLVFTDKDLRKRYAFHTKMVFHFILIIQYQNKVSIHMGIQNDIIEVDQINTPICSPGAFI